LSPALCPTTAHTTNPFFASAAVFTRKVLAEDDEICRRVDPDFPLDGPGRILSATEEKVRHVRDSCEAVVWSLKN
jgi:hypothetical protein